MKMLLKIILYSILFFIIKTFISLELSLMGINEYASYIIAILSALIIVFLLWKKFEFTLEKSIYIIVGGLITGFISFILGFIGPIIITPEANQGPLLGIFITGPLGFTLGLFIGWLFWFKKNNKKNN